MKKLYTATGFENGEDESLLNGAVTRGSGEDVRSYSIQLGSLSAGLNYTLNFTELVLTANMVVTPADVSGTIFVDGSFVYDGNVKSLAITGTLPDGTSVAYTENSRTDVGIQEVTATFSGSNYNELVLMADLIIIPAEIPGVRVS